MKLEHKNITSKAFPLQDLDWNYIKERMKNTTVVCWLFNGVNWGTIDEAGKITWVHGTDVDDEDISEMRVFNSDEEIYLRRIDSKSWIGRIRSDQNMEGDSVICDTENYLWGKSSVVKGNNTHLFEDNGMQLEIPGQFPDVRPANRVKLTLRNYIEYNEINLAGYTDARFLTIQFDKK